MSTAAGPPPTVPLNLETWVSPSSSRPVPPLLHTAKVILLQLQLDIMRTSCLAIVSKRPRSNQYKVVSNLVTSAVEFPDYHMHNHNRNEAKQQLTLYNSSAKHVCMHFIRGLQTTPYSRGSLSNFPELRSNAVLILNTLDLD